MNANDLTERSRKKCGLEAHGGKPRALACKSDSSKTSAVPYTSSMAFPELHPSLLRALATRNYTEPTPVQQAVLRPEAALRDLLVSAQTGSGKTAAYGLSLGETLLGEEPRFGRPKQPLALVVAPTRELALQVHRELAWLLADAGGRVTSCVGGMDIRREQRALEAGAHVVVGTPGRLADHLDRDTWISRRFVQWCWMRPMRCWISDSAKNSNY
jgi:superfamily II DNA/RNA helicase